MVAPQAAANVQSFRENNPQGEVLLYASLPCVGGSPWGYINRLTDSGAERIEQQKKDFTKLFKSLQKLIHEIDGPHFQLHSNSQRTASTGSGQWFNLF